jgi:hypothetical protein
MNVASPTLIACLDRLGLYVFIDSGTGNRLYGPFHSTPDHARMAKAVEMPMALVTAVEFERYCAVTPKSGQPR